MNRILILISSVLLLTLLSGCEFVYEYNIEDGDSEFDEEYVYIPDDIEHLIEESVYGYSVVSKIISG